MSEPTPLTKFPLQPLLVGAGLGARGQEINLVPAPLLRSTCNLGKNLTPMPFLADSAYTPMKEAFAAVMVPWGLMNAGFNLL